MPTRDCRPTSPQAQEDNHNGTSPKDTEPVRPSARTFESHSTIGSLPGSRHQSRSPYYLHKGPARSGSITENIVDANGVRKVVLETTSSSESNEEDGNSGANKGQQPFEESKDSSAVNPPLEERENGSKKKKRRRRKHGHGSNKGEREPLLGD